MKTIGLIFVLVGFLSFWVLGLKCYSLQAYQQLLSNWLHVSIGGSTIGDKVPEAVCP